MKNEGRGKRKGKRGSGEEERRGKEERERIKEEGGKSGVSDYN